MQTNASSVTPAGYPGSTHDAFIWRNSDLRRRFHNDEFGDGVLLGELLVVKG